MLNAVIFISFCHFLTSVIRHLSHSWVNLRNHRFLASLRQTTTCRVYKENVQGVFHFKNMREEQASKQAFERVSLEIVLFSLVYRPAPKGLGPQYPRGRVRSREKEELTSPPTLFPLLSSCWSVGGPGSSWPPATLHPLMGRLWIWGTWPSPSVLHKTILFLDLHCPFLSHPASSILRLHSLPLPFLTYCR